MWVGLLEITISVFGAKNAVGSGDSGYKPEYSEFWKTPGETPVISPDTPDISPDSPDLE